MGKHRRRNTPAFTFMSYSTLIVGVALFAIGLYNAEMQLNEKGYYIAVMCLVIVGSILTQKVTRDNDDDKYILETLEEKEKELEKVKM